MVSDGDTFKAKTDSLGEIKIRLADIDAPELDQEYGKEAKDFLIKKIWKDSVTLFIKEKDQYGRYLSLVFLGTTNFKDSLIEITSNDTNFINNLLVREGYAWHYKYSKNHAIMAFERDAQRLKKGLWGKCTNSVAPWEFRKLEKLEKEGKIKDETSIWCY